MNSLKPVILLVDDNDLVLNTTKLALINENFEFLTASNGKTAYEIILNTPPAIILTDVTMPEMDGLELCRKIKSNPKTQLIPVIIVTGYNNFEDKILAKQAGADEFLSKPINIIELKIRIHSLLKNKVLIDQLEDISTVVESFAKAIDARDAYTQGHNHRVRFLTIKICNKMDLLDEIKEDIYKAAILHDIGKIGIKENILNKPGKLTLDEKEIMQSHPVIGEKILEPLKTSLNFRAMIRSHHEKLDGSGYPDGLKGLEISNPVRILSLADIFDAMRSTRPYRDGISNEKTLIIIRNEVQKGFWDKDIYKILEKISYSKECRDLYI